MGSRMKHLSRAIVKAIITEPSHDNISILSRIIAFFHFLTIGLERFKPEIFFKLRDETWWIDENTYRDAFGVSASGKSLQSAGDLGFSGSAFFTTANSEYLVKSLPRYSEYHFFAVEMLDHWVDYMTKQPASLLVRVTDFLHAPKTTLGSLFRITPAHYIVMENILHGKDSDPKADQWETYDLKPVSYFYPERDLAGGHLASDSVKERLLDTFEDKVRVSKADGQVLIDQLTEDSKLLMECNVVDYSLFLIRFPLENLDDVEDLNSRTSEWRAGVISTDRKWVYRAVILDYFWAKHKIHAQLMTGLIKSFNFFSGQGHMSITTSAEDYRMRFLKMVEQLFERPTQ